MKFGGNMKGSRLKDVLDDSVLDHKFWNGIFAKMNQLLVLIERTNPSIDDQELRWVSDRIERWEDDERILTVESTGELNPKHIIL